MARRGRSTTIEPTTTILDALDDPDLFALAFEKGSWSAWRAFLAAVSGLPMSPAQRKTFRACTGRKTPPTKPAREAWLVVRSRGWGFSQRLPFLLSSAAFATSECRLNAELGVGFAVSATQRAAFALTDADSFDSTTALLMAATDRCIEACGTALFAHGPSADFVSNDADGFTLSVLTACTDSTVRGPTPTVSIGAG